MESASQGNGYPDGPSSVTRVLGALTALVGEGRRVGAMTLFCCPVHGDAIPTLCVRHNLAAAFVELSCSAGCPRSEILSAIGLTDADLTVESHLDTLPRSAFTEVGGSSSRTYTYVGADGNRLGQVSYVPADGQTTIKTRRWNAQSRRWASGDFGDQLYRQPELAAAAGEPIWLVADEYVAELAGGHGLAATCAAGGFSAFGPQHVHQLGATSHVVIVADRCERGYREAVRIRQLLCEARPGATISVVEPAAGPDLAQHFAAGRGPGDLVAIDPARQLAAPADPAEATAPLAAAPAAPTVVPVPRRGGRGGGDDDDTPNSAARYVHRHGQTVQVRSSHRDGKKHTWYEVVWLCEVRVRKITYQDLAEDPGAPRIPGSWLIELRRRVIDDSGHYVCDSDSIDGFAYETASATIAADDFHTPGWPDLLPWAGVIANETPNGRAKARAAAIAVSGIRSTTPAFAATGWRDAGGSAIYVHPGGAITDSGELLGDVTLDLPARFSPLAMSAPISAGEPELLAHAVTHGLDPLLQQLPAEVAAPLIGYAFRTFLGKPRGSIHLMGAPGTGKTVAARVCGMSWTSASFHEHGHTSLFTGGDKMDDSMRALAMLMHSAKDALVLVDEFKGRTAQERVNALHTLFWNGQERSVSTTRGQIRRSSGAPRCGLLTTGEVGSVGSSATRTLTLAINRDVVSDPVTVWSHLESAGSRALRSQIGASFVQWLAADHDAKVTAAQRYGTGVVTTAWQQFCASLPHTEGLAGRLVAIAADITVGWAVLLQFLLERGAVDQQRADGIWAWAMGGLAAQMRAQDHSVGDGAEQLLALIREAMTSGAGHATDRSTGEVPTVGIGATSDETEVARAFGWATRGGRGGGDGTVAAVWTPRGNHLGVVDPVERVLYLFPRETLATMAAMTARVGEHFTATSATITSSLGRRGWLGVEGDGTKRSRIRIAGVLTSVWPVPLHEFYGCDVSDRSDDGGSQQYPLAPWQARPRIVPPPVDDADDNPVADPGATEGRDGPDMTQEMLDFGADAPPLLTVVPEEPDVVDDVAAETGGETIADGAGGADNAARGDEGGGGEDDFVGDDTSGAHDRGGEAAPGGEAAAAPEPPSPDTAGGGDAPTASVSLRPLVSAGGEPWRWLYASATVTDTALVLPDGETIPISYGAGGDISHLGHLVDLAAALHLGFGGGKSLPEAAQLLLTEGALAQLGVTLPPAEDLAKEPNPFEVIATAGAALIKATLDAGYQTSKAGTLRSWTKVWRGSQAAEFVLLPAVSITDTQSKLLIGDVEPVDLAYRLHRVAELLGTTYSTSGAVTGRRLYERLHPPGGRAMTPTDLVPPLEPFRRSPGRIAAGTMTWARSMTADEQRHGFVAGYDLRANYLTAAQKAVVGMGAPTHHSEGIDFDPKIAGLWRITLGATQYPGFVDASGGDPLLPNILELARPNANAASGWFTTPTVKYIVNELDWPVQVEEAYTWETSRRLLESWAKHVNTARLPLEQHLVEHPGEPNARAELSAIKQIYRGFVGRLAYAGDRDDKGQPTTPWHRPDWRATIQAEANVDLHRKIRRIAEATGRFPIAVLTDEVIYTSEDPDPVTGRPEPMPMGIGLGQWNTSRSHPVTPQLIAALKPLSSDKAITARQKALGALNELLPKNL